MDQYKNYIHDLGALVVERGLQAKKEAEDSSSDFAVGKLSAIHDIVTIMLELSKNFNLDVNTIGLNDVKPDKDLLIYREANN
jgi:hypothetical protein